MRVVFILKPGHNLTLMKSWHPLNLINYVWKLEEKVVADRMQDFEGNSSTTCSSGQCGDSRWCMSSIAQL